MPNGHMDANRICSRVFFTKGPALLISYRPRAALIRGGVCAVLILVIETIFVIFA